MAIGSANGGIASTLEQSRLLGTLGYRGVSPHAVTMLMANGPAAWLSIDLGAKAGARAPVRRARRGRGDRDGTRDDPGGHGRRRRVRGVEAASRRSRWPRSPGPGDVHAQRRAGSSFVRSTPPATAS
ncbi:hypothetical protein NKG05_28650 [Oerskovia sp. M15]